MSSDRFAEVERLYHEATLLRQEERAAFLDQGCGGDDALRHEVESLLSLPTDADEFLSRTALEEAARAGDRPAEPQSWPTIPGYTVRRVLGEGGMGVVYLAEQETPFRRLVALKLIKPGMDTRRVVARFETERQALALMDHPNIAAVFDAGSTDKGRPYFVMEYVDGVSITEYCDRRRLSTQDRLALFVQVCAAVQHAHQKGVIHRDLKPSNVLVAELDGHPLPKVIDFGTAKAVAGAWNATATQGGQGLVLGTLEYMSPEQAALSADIDTATDVYSLGVLLYELLVGRLPFDTDELRAAGYDEIRRVIRESDPPKPSVRVEQRRGKSATAALARQTDAPGLTRQLRGDLDWITLKALEKDRARRYATVAAFATDIERFLGDQPVDARPPSSTYRIRKFTRRHRLAVVAAAAIIITILSIGVTLSTALYWQAETSRREAGWQRQQATEQREQRSAAERAAAYANEQRARAVNAQADAETQRSIAMTAAATTRAALKESNYLAYVANLAAAAGDLRTGAAAEARARLLTVSEAQRGWEWRHLFIQSDESDVKFTSTASPCPVGPFSNSLGTTALRLAADGQSILLRRCLTLERWTLPAFTHSLWSAPAGSVELLAENSRGQMLSLTTPPGYRLALTDPAGSEAAVTFGPFASRPKCADISPDGARIAVGFLPVTFRDNVFEVWSVATGNLEYRVLAAPATFPNPVNCVVRFSPDGGLLATSGASVDVWEAGTGVARIADSELAGGFTQPIEFGPGGHRLAIGRADGRVDVLDLGRSSPMIRLDESILNADRGTSTTMTRPNRAVRALAFSPDGQCVVSGTSTTIGVWDIGQAKLVRVLAGHAAGVTDVAVSSDGRRIYSVDAAGVVRAWSLGGAPAVVRTTGSSAFSYPFSASADGSIIATNTRDGAIVTTRTADLRQEVIQAGIGRLVTGSLIAAISPDGGRLFAAENSISGAIRRWRLGSMDAVNVARTPDSSCNGELHLASLTVSPDGALLAFSERNCVVVWNAFTMERLAILNDTRSPRTVAPTQLLFRDEATLIISTLDLAGKTPSLVRVWNWRADRILATVEPVSTIGPQNGLWGVALSPDRRRIALISSQVGTQRTVSIWDGELKFEIGRLPPGDYQAVAFSPDGRRIASVGADETAVRIWDSERLLPLLTLSDTDSHMGGVVFTATGQIVAGRTGGGLTIWESQVRRR